MKLRKGVQFHDSLGEFTAKDVVHSWNYYTNGGCKASYSDYFRNDPGSDLEVVGDHELIIRTVERPALLYDYWLSEYRGVPISSKAQAAPKARPSMKKVIADWEQKAWKPIPPEPTLTSTSTSRRA